MARLFDGQTARSRPVESWIVGDALMLREADGTEHRWSLPGLTRLPGADPNAGIVLARDRARLVLSTDELRSLELAARARLGKQKGGFRIAALVVAMIGIAVVIVQFAPGLLVPLVPSALERGVSDLAQEQMFGKVRRCARPEAQAALDRFAVTLAGLEQSIRIEVLDTGMVNALTLPDGRVLLLRGLIDQAGDGAELAGVLAHETAHHLYRDPTRETVRGVFLILAGEIAGDALLAEPLRRTYSRSIEARADRTGLDLLHQAGLRADGLAQFLKRMPTDGSLAWLSDHPATADRIRASAGPATGAEPFTPDEWESIRAMCSAGASTAARPAAR